MVCYKKENTECTSSKRCRFCQAKYSIFRVLIWKKDSNLKVKPKEIDNSVSILLLSSVFLSIFHMYVVKSLRYVFLKYNNYFLFFFLFCYLANDFVHWQIRREYSNSFVNRKNELHRSSILLRNIHDAVWAQRNNLTRVVQQCKWFTKLTCENHIWLHNKIFFNLAEDFGVAVDDQADREAEHEHEDGDVVRTRALVHVAPVGAAWQAAVLHDKPAPAHKRKRRPQQAVACTREDGHHRLERCDPAGKGQVEHHNVTVQRNTRQDTNVSDAKKRGDEPVALAPGLPKQPRAVETWRDNKGETNKHHEHITNDAPDDENVGGRL